MVRTVSAVFLLVGLSSPFAAQPIPTAQIRKELQHIHEEYVSVSRTIYAQHEDPESEPVHVSDPAQGESRLHNMVEQAVLQNAPYADGADVKESITAVQGELGLSAGWPDSTNLPFADFSHVNGGEALTAAYVILQGGDVIPDTRPYLEFYIRGPLGWQMKASAGSEFRGCGLFVSRMNAGLAGETWYLAWGKKIGATSSALKIRLYAFDGNNVRTVWKRDDLVRGLIDVAPGSITLDYATRYAPTERVDRIHEVLYITPNGLE